MCAARHHHDLAYLPQQAELDRAFPIEVRQLIALGAWRSFGAYRRPRDEVFERVAQAAAATGLENVLKRPVEELPVGEFQRALFARLLLQDAAVILLDEPFAAVDESTTEDLMGLVRRWRMKAAPWSPCFTISTRCGMIFRYRCCWRECASPGARPPRC